MHRVEVTNRFDRTAYVRSSVSSGSDDTQTGDGGEASPPEEPLREGERFSSAACCTQVGLGQQAVGLGISRQLRPRTRALTNVRPARFTVPDPQPRCHGSQTHPMVAGQSASSSCWLRGWPRSESIPSCTSTWRPTPTRPRLRSRSLRCFPAHPPRKWSSQVTIPLEVALAGMPGLHAMNSKTVFGLSDIKMLFDYGFEYKEARQETHQSPAIDAVAAGGRNARRSRRSRPRARFFATCCGPPKTPPAATSTPSTTSRPCRTGCWSASSAPFLGWWT